MEYILYSSHNIILNSDGNITQMKRAQYLIPLVLGWVISIHAYYKPQNYNSQHPRPRSPATDTAAALNFPF